MIDGIYGGNPGDIPDKLPNVNSEEFSGTNPLGMSRAKYVLHLERDLNYIRLCVGNILMLQERMHQIQDEMFCCAACNLSVPGTQTGLNQCVAHKEAIEKWDKSWEGALGMCFAAVEGRSGKDLHEYIKNAVDRGKKAQDALKLAEESEQASSSIKKIT